MPSYEISCHRDDGTIVLKYSVECTGDTHARTLANGLTMKEPRWLEVWRGESLIYVEPPQRMN